MVPNIFPNCRCLCTQKECSCCGPACSLVPATATEGSRELYWDLLHGAQFFKMSSLEQRLSRIEEKLKQENEEARRRIDLNIDMSPHRSRPRPSECPRISCRESVSARGTGQISRGGGRCYPAPSYMLTRLAT